MSDKIDEFIAKLKKELARQNAITNEWHPEYLGHRLAALERRLKSKAERIIEKQESIDNSKTKKDLKS